MNREELKELGLTDEQIDKVMASHGTVVNATKDQLETVTIERDDLKGQITDRDTQLNDLSDKLKDNEDLTAEINRLKAENTTATTDLQEKLDKQAFDFTLERALTNAKVRNPKAVKALLDVENIKLDGDTLLNLDEQLNSLKESDDYLFESETKPNSPQIVAGGNPNGGGNPTLSRADIMKETDTTKRQRLIQENRHLFQ